MPSSSNINPATIFLGVTAPLLMLARLRRKINKAKSITKIKCDVSSRPLITEIEVFATPKQIRDALINFYAPEGLYYTKLKMHLWGGIYAFQYKFLYNRFLMRNAFFYSISRLPKDEHYRYKRAVTKAEWAKHQHMVGTDNVININLDPNDVHRLSVTILSKYQCVMGIESIQEILEQVGFKTRLSAKQFELLGNFLQEAAIRERQRNATLNVPPPKDASRHQQHLRNFRASSLVPLFHASANRHENEYKNAEVRKLPHDLVRLVAGMLVGPRPEM